MEYMSKADVILNSPHIIVVGNPFIGGYRVYGPFKNREEAEKWKKNELDKVIVDQVQFLSLIEPW